MNKRIAEYIVIHKTDHVRFQKAINELADEGFTLMGPVQFAVDNELINTHQYIATMERKVEAREQQEET